MGQPIVSFLRHSPARVTRANPEISLHHLQVPGSALKGCPGTTESSRELHFKQLYETIV
jgi:hypothetical protein